MLFLAAQHSHTKTTVIMPLSSTLQKKLLAEDSGEEYAVQEPPPVVSVASLSSSQSTLTDNSTTTLADYGLSLFVKQQLLTEVLKQGGVLNVSQTTRSLSKVCNRNPQLFGGKVGTTPRNRRKQCKNFITKLKGRYKDDPQRLQLAIDKIFSAEAVPDEEDACGIELKPPPNKPPPSKPPPQEQKPLLLNPSKQTMSSKASKKKSKGNKAVVTVPSNARKYCCLMHFVSVVLS